jgi:hypothetical protein
MNPKMKPHVGGQCAGNMNSCTSIVPQTFYIRFHILKGVTSKEKSYEIYRLVCWYQFFRIPWRWKQQFLLNVGNYLPNYTASHPGRPYTQIFYFVPLKRLQNLRVKVKVLPNKPWGMRLGIELWASILNVTFGTTRTDRVSSTRRPHFTRSKFIVTHFC